MTDEPQKQTTEAPEPVETVPKDQYLRLAADFENYRRQQAQDLTSMAKFAGQSVITEMLELVDMIDAAVAHAPPEVTGQTAWFGGLEQVSKQFHKDMKKYGVEKIETVGKTFDPSTMEAVSMTGGGESHTVKEEARAGYLMHDRVIRPARVVIYE